MTERCRILILIAIVGSLLGILRNQPALMTLSLSMLIWIFLVWLHFTIRLGWLWPRLKISRQVNARAKVPTTLWAGRPVDVQLTVTAPHWVPLPRCLTLRDLVPGSITVSEGALHRILPRNAHEAKWNYRCQFPAAGLGEWFGVHFRFQDSQGLFLAERVYQQRHGFRILPPFSPPGDAKSLIKRTNSIPQQGIHQLKRSGLGAELLELTEYQPGDPPKSIAWKVSARRGQLMTRQYESEVPIRLMLFLDDGQSMRRGQPGNRPLDEAIHLAASVAKAAVGVGDSIGILCTSGAETRARAAVATGDKAFYRVLSTLAEFSSSQHPQPDATHLPQAAVLSAASQLARARHPELLQARLETPVWTLLPLRPALRRGLQLRRQLARVLAEVYGLSAARSVELAHDQSALARLAADWLAESGIEIPALPLPDQASTTLGPQAMAEALARSVALAKDNEVYVLFVDLLQPDQGATTDVALAAGTDALLSAAKVAIGRHHRVVFLCPLDYPAEGDAHTAPQNLADVARQVQRIQVDRRTRSLRRYLRSFGATSAFLGQQKVVATVMAEAELAGSGRFTAGVR